MSWQTRPAVRTNVGILIGIAGPTGCGKTWSAMELATGLTPPGQRFVVIDTEHDRALFYADDFAFDHCPFEAPYSSARYADVIEHHIMLGYKVIVVDSASHEYIGEGGMHDEHDRILDEMVKRSKRGGEEWQIRDALTWPAWKEPKQQHKRFKAKLTSLPSGVHVIMCFRAEQKTAMVKVKDDSGRQRSEIRLKEGPTGRDGWFPLCDAALPYEMVLSFLMLPQAPGLPLPIKPIPERLKPFFPLDQLLDRKSGLRLAEWARGGAPGRVTGIAIIDELSRRDDSAAPANGGPSPEPDERTRLLASIDKLAGEVKFSEKDRKDAWHTYLGRGVTREKAEVAGLADLLKWMRTRAKQMGVTR